MDQLYSLAHARSYAQRKASIPGIFASHWKSLLLSPFLIGFSSVFLLKGDEPRLIGMLGLSIAIAIVMYVYRWSYSVKIPAYPAVASRWLSFLQVIVGLVVFGCSLAYGMMTMDLTTLKVLGISFGLSIVAGGLIGYGLGSTYLAFSKAQAMYIEKVAYADRVLTSAYAFGPDDSSRWDYRFMANYWNKTAQLFAADSLCAVERYKESLDLALLSVMDSAEPNGAAARDLKTITTQRKAELQAKERREVLTPVKPGSRAKPQRTKADVNARLAEAEKALGK